MFEGVNDHVQVHTESFHSHTICIIEDRDCVLPGVYILEMACENTGYDVFSTCSLRVGKEYYFQNQI